MKILALFALTLPLLAQSGLPTHCTLGVLRVSPTGIDAGNLYKCYPANTWAIVGAAAGSVTSVGLAGTANQITVTGASPITAAGSWTLSFPAGGVTLPGTTTGTFSGAVSGNASTATALAANGANCSAGNFPLGVDASGASESCTALPTTLTGTANQIAVTGATGAITISIPSSPTLPGTTTGTFSGNITGNVTGNATGSSGTVTSIASHASTELSDTASIVYTTRAVNTTTPITGGGALSADRTIACATCVTSSSPGAGVAHFAGSTQAVTSSGVVNADLSGLIGLAHGGVNLDLTATGGTSQVLKQTSLAGAVTVARLACADLSDSSASCATDATVASNLASGSLPAARTPNLPFTNWSQRGTILAAGFNLDANTGRIVHPFAQVSAGSTACVNPNSQYWEMPLGGYLRNITGTTGITNATSPIRWMIAPGCPNAALLSNGGPVTQTGVVAGGVIDTWSNNNGEAWHVNQWNSLGMGFVRLGLTATAAPTSVAMEFLSDDGLQATIIGHSRATALTASQTQFFAFGGSLNATEDNTALPIPVAGTFSKFFITTTTTPTATVAVTFRKNKAATSIVATVGATDSGGTQVDLTHTSAVVAGDAVDVQTISGGTTQATVQAIGLAFTPTTAGDTFVWGSFAVGTVTTTNKYALPFSDLNSTTIAAAEMTMPMACTLSNLYVYQAAANAGSTVTTFTLMRNGSATGITGTVGVGASGSQLVDGAHTQAYVAGDLLTLQYITNTGTSGAMSAWSAKCS